MFYQIYLLLRGSVAFNILIGLFAVYLIYLLVRALDMTLLSTILGQFIGVGVIALMIVFQQELRRFLLLIGSRYLRSNRFNLEKMFSFGHKSLTEDDIKNITDACVSLSSTKTGALIVISRKSSLEDIIITGEVLNAKISSGLIESIFFKNNPLHDGAMIINENLIKGARCILPVTENVNLPPQYGMRHRAAIGITEETDAIVIVVSEQTGGISFSSHGTLKYSITREELIKILYNEFIGHKKQVVAETI